MSITEGGDHGKRKTNGLEDFNPYATDMIHPCAKRIPLNKDDFAEFKKNMQEGGGFNHTISRIKIWQDTAGKDGPKSKWWIVSGRRRHKACLEIGHVFDISRDFEVLPPTTDPWSFSVKDNLDRGQLDTAGKRQWVRHMHGLFPADTDAALARRCHVDPKTVKSVREDMAKDVEKIQDAFKKLTDEQRKDFLTWAIDQPSALEFPSQS